MRIAAVIAVFVVVLAASLVGMVAPSSGQTLPPLATATPCAGDCGPIPTARPTASISPTPDPGCTDNCGPIPTPRPIISTPAPGCIDPCFPFPTPRPTYEPGAPVEPANPQPGKDIGHYEFLPMLHQ